MRHASDLWSRGEKSLAQIYLTQLRLPELAEPQAFRLFLADRLMASGFSPRELCKQLGFALPFGLRKYSPDQARDGRGRWTSGSDFGSASSGDVQEGRSVSPGGHHGGEESEDDKLDQFKAKLGETTPQEDLEHGRPIDPMGPTPFPFPGASPKTAPLAGPKPSDFAGVDFGKYGIGVDKPSLEIDYWTYHANKRATERALSFDEMRDIVANPLLVTRQSNSRFYYLSDNGAVVVDDYGRVVTDYGSSNFKEGVINMLERVHSGDN
ncbi:MAG: hypothetical protein ACLPSF_02210 [Methylocella sp.]